MRSVGRLAGVALCAMAFNACSGASSPTAPSATSGLAGGGPTVRVGQDGRFQVQQRDWTDSERGLALNLATSNAGLIQISGAADDRADLSEVKFFAFQLWHEFRQGQSELQEMGGSQLPSLISASADDQATIRTVSALGGSAFDRAFMSAVVEMLQTHIALISQAGGTARQPALDGAPARSSARAAKFLSWARELARRVGAA